MLLVLLSRCSQRQQRPALTERLLFSRLCAKHFRDTKSSQQPREGGAQGLPVAHKRKAELGKRE